MGPPTIHQVSATPRDKLEDALGSLALEGLQPSPAMRELLERAGEATDAELRAAEQEVLRRRQPLAPGTSRAA